jgi:hypothetical protein
MVKNQRVLWIRALLADDCLYSLALTGLNNTGTPPVAATQAIATYKLQVHRIAVFSDGTQ